MNDLISRQAVIELVKDSYYNLAESMEDTWAMVEDVERLPSAQPEQRKKGKWILHTDDLFPAESTMECNQCHEHQPISIDDNFCPNCGADMKGEQE